MSDATPRLGLPWLMPAQAQKHVTVNEALGRLDSLVGASVASRTAAGQPAEPQDGVAYILPAGAEGTDWEDFFEHDLAHFQDGAWARIAARTGLIAYVADEGGLVVFDGSAWVSAGAGIAALENLQGLGVGTVSDTANPFAAKLNGALWTARYEGEGGTGDLRCALNKEAPGDTLSVVYQSDWSGRAEIGLTGSDDLSIKVSADGAAWTEAVRIDREDGSLNLAGGLRIAGSPAASLLFTPGGDGVVSIWRLDASHGPLPRSVVIGSVAGDRITLSAPDVPQFTSAAMTTGASLLRIWNSSRSPEESAWLKAAPDWGAGNRILQVTDPADITGWSPGDVVRVGEPAPDGSWVCAIDVSPMMRQVFGAEFPQSGLMVKAVLISETAGDQISLSPTGESGSYAAAAITSAPGLAAGAGVTVVACTQASPISNSNLVLVREGFAAQASLELISVSGVFR